MRSGPALASLNKRLVTWLKDSRKIGIINRANYDGGIRTPNQIRGSVNPSHNTAAKPRLADHELKKLSSSKARFF